MNRPVSTIRYRGVKPTGSIARRISLLGLAVLLAGLGLSRPSIAQEQGGAGYQEGVDIGGGHILLVDARERRFNEIVAGLAPENRNAAEGCRGDIASAHAAEDEAEAIADQIRSGEYTKDLVDQLNAAIERRNAFLAQLEACLNQAIRLQPVEAAGAEPDAAEPAGDSAGQVGPTPPAGSVTGSPGGFWGNLGAVASGTGRGILKFATDTVGGTIGSVAEVGDTLIDTAVYDYLFLKGDFEGYSAYQPRSQSYQTTRQGQWGEVGEAVQKEVQALPTKTAENTQKWWADATSNDPARIEQASEQAAALGAGAVTTVVPAGAAVRLAKAAQRLRTASRGSSGASLSGAAGAGDDLARAGSGGRGPAGSGAAASSPSGTGPPASGTPPAELGQGSFGRVLRHPTQPGMAVKEFWVKDNPFEGKAALSRQQAGHDLLAETNGNLPPGQDPIPFTKIHESGTAADGTPFLVMEDATAPSRWGQGAYVKDKLDDFNGAEKQAMRRLEKKLADNGLVWLDPNPGNVNFFNKGGVLEAGIIDHDFVYSIEQAQRYTNALADKMAPMSPYTTLQEFAARPDVAGNPVLRTFNYKVPGYWYGQYMKTGVFNAHEFMRAVGLAHGY